MPINGNSACREVAKTAKGAFHVRGAGVLETSLGRSRSMIAAVLDDNDDDG